MTNLHFDIQQNLIEFWIHETVFEKNGKSTSLNIYRYVVCLNLVSWLEKFQNVPSFEQKQQYRCW